MKRYTRKLSILVLFRKSQEVGYNCNNEKKNKHFRASIHFAQAHSDRSTMKTLKATALESQRT